MREIAHIAADADHNAGFVVAKVSLDPAAKTSNAVFSGTYVAGLASKGASKTSTSPETDDKGVTGYSANERRKAKSVAFTGQVSGDTANFKH